MLTINAFLGVRKQKDKTENYILMLSVKDKVETMKPVHVASSGKTTVLLALLDLLKDISEVKSDDITVNFYSNSDSVKNDWIKGNFSSNELWKDILKILNESRIELNIYGKESNLKKLNEISNKKLK